MRHTDCEVEKVVDRLVVDFVQVIDSDVAQLYIGQRSIFALKHH